MQPLDETLIATWIIMWQSQLEITQDGVRMNLKTNQYLPADAQLGWPTWRNLNHLWTGTGKIDVNMQLWGYCNDANAMCECGGNFYTSEYLLTCPQIGQPHAIKDFTKATDWGIVPIGAPKFEHSDRKKKRRRRRRRQQPVRFEVLWDLAYLKDELLINIIIFFLIK